MFAPLKPKTAPTTIPTRTSQAPTPTTSSSGPASHTPTPIPIRRTNPADLKDNGQTWERRFTGVAGTVEFNLRLQRNETGHLHARYQVTPGKGEGWHLEGQLREDNSFALKGTENGALFTGQLTQGGYGISGSFTNNEFSVPQLNLNAPRRAARQTPDRPVPEVGVVDPAPGTRNPGVRGSSVSVEWQAQRSGNPQFDANTELQQKIVWAALELGVNPNDLAACISFESAGTFDPAVPNGAGGNAIGLIQFLSPSFAQMRQYLQVASSGSAAAQERRAEIAKYGWDAARLNRASFASMTVAEQMSYVVLHFKAHRLAPGSGLQDLYRKVIAPFANSDQMYVKGTQYYDENSGLDLDGDGVITAVEAVRKIINQGHARQYYAQTGVRTDGSPTTAQADSKTGTGSSVLHGLLSREKLTAEQIAQARQLIGDLPAADQAKLYATLQTKVVYRNQRNNASTPLASDVATWGKGLTDKIGIGFIMCQVTALAMSLEYLGVANPNPEMQYEDFLEQRGRITQGGGWERFTSTDWMKLAQSMGVSAVQVYGVNTRSWWLNNMRSSFTHGKAVMLSVGNNDNAHVVRVQAVTDRGLLIDDPNGQMTAAALTKNKGFDVDAYRTNQYKNQGSESGGSYGEDNLWTWEMLKLIPQRYVVILSKP